MFPPVPSVCEAANLEFELAERERAPKVALLESWLAWRVAILPAVREVRRSGFMITVELGMSNGLGDPAHLVELAARRRGIEATSDGERLVLTPPFTSSEADLRRLVAGLASSIAEVAVGRLPAAA
jgi:adenosylmethionine-8-amino-7-oxononanoate aminotransferase